MLYIPKLRRKLVACSFAICAAAGSAHAAVTYATVGEYDENTTGTNTVDFNANGNLLTATGANDFAGFKADVATAFTAGKGGVVPFESATDVTITGPISATYGVGGNKSLDINFSTANMKVQGFTSSTPISGARGIYTGTESNASFSFSFGPITGGDPGEAVTRVALTLLGRTGFTAGDTFTLTAKFSDNSTSVLTAGTEVATAAGKGDTFYAFTAPAGLSISSITYSSTTTVGRTILMDDLGFITSVVPEPGALGVIGSGALALLARRKKR